MSGISQVRTPAPALIGRIMVGLLLAMLHESSVNGPQFQLGHDAFGVAHGYWPNTDYNTVKRLQ